MNGVDIVRFLPETEWRRFIEDNPNGNVFHTPEMFEVFKLAHGYEPEIWAAVNAGKIMALLLPVQINLMEGVLRRLTTRAVSYGSILYRPGVEGEESLGILLRAYTSEKKKLPLFTELRHVSDVGPVLPILNKFGFVYEGHLNYMIDLNKAPAEIFKNINKSGQKAIKKAMRSGVNYLEVQNPDLLSTYYDLLMQTYLRAKVPLADMSLFRAILEILVPRGMAKMQLAAVDGHYVAASLELPYKDTIYSWYSGYDYNYRHACPNDYLVWKILEWGAENGYRMFDFGGGGRVGQVYGPGEFKAKFGGQLVNFGRHIYVHSPLALRLSSIAYRVYRMVGIRPNGTRQKHQ